MSYRGVRGYGSKDKLRIPALIRSKDEGFPVPGGLVVAITIRKVAKLAARKNICPYKGLLNPA